MSRFIFLVDRWTSRRVDDHVDVHRINLSPDGYVLVVDASDLTEATTKAVNKIAQQLPADLDLAISEIPTIIFVAQLDLTGYGAIMADVVQDRVFAQWQRAAQERREQRERQQLQQLLAKYPDAVPPR